MKMKVKKLIENSENLVNKNSENRLEKVIETKGLSYNKGLDNKTDKILTGKWIELKLWSTSE